MAKPGPATYILKGGKSGCERLNILARALAPTTNVLLDSMGPLTGQTAIDAACGAGQVTIELARRVGRRGRVIGLDLDATKLAAGETAAGERGYSHVAFKRADILEPWPVGMANLVYCRFILTHLASPQTMLERAKHALIPGGRLVVEDIDADGVFWDPPHPGMQRLRELYIATAHHRGVDPFIGRRLDRLFEAAGFRDVGMALVHPYGREGDAKLSPVLIAAALADAAVAAKLATRDEMVTLDADLRAYAARRDTMIAMPRVFQAWGTLH